ncbi:MAG TPA: YrhA family protein [Hymenobacter sp.]|jgi:hypothetical protein|uniref:YrhA family protein n=1 Tax=Hymenobacter sp. TaxID=1898978 RepID=UPI002ED827EA
MILSFEIFTLVNTVLDRLKQYEVKKQPPLSKKSQEVFRRRVADTLSYELPPVYLGLLAVADGLDWNGIVLYASETRLRDDDELDAQGLLEANIQLRLAHTPDKDFVYFAESGMDAYRHNLAANKFEVADRVVGDSVFEPFDTAEELFQHLLTNMLNAGDDDESDF